MMIAGTIGPWTWREFVLDEKATVRFPRVCETRPGKGSTVAEERMPLVASVCKGEEPEGRAISS